MNTEERRYYVYLQMRKDNNQVFYVGKGVGDRCKRRKKSKSWNKVFNEAGGFTYEIVKDNLTEKEALALETELITNPKDSWNLVNSVSSFTKQTTDISKLKEYVYYDESAPSCLRHSCWNNSKIKKTARFKDDAAGSISRESATTAYYMMRVHGKTFLVHRLVWMIFNGDIDDGLVVNHINNNSLDNRISNLELVTQAVNARRTVKTKKEGAGVHTSVITGIKYSIANWIDEDGNRKSKAFSHNKYGEEQAFQLATDMRKSKMVELKHLGY